jgi:hypothetical protein
MERKCGVRAFTGETIYTAFDDGVEVQLRVELDDAAGEMTP